MRYLIRCSRGFTLAEILITIGIIGVVAAMTLPVLIQNHKKSVAETYLRKFYSVINQAIILAELDYGAREDWYGSDKDVDTDKNGNIVAGTTQRAKWLNKYIVPYIKNSKVEEVDWVSGGQRPIIYFADGSSLLCIHQTALTDWVLFTSNPQKCINSNKNNPWSTGTCSFKFIYYPLNSAKKDVLSWKYVGNSFEPYKFGWDGSIENLYSDCYSGGGSYCAALIQFNGWKIPKDYPKRIK